jgi:hypothetical protein
MADSPISIASDTDWQVLVDKKLTTVVDPMVFRAGEIFLRGRSGSAFGDAATSLPEDERWRFLEMNTLAIGFFFDALIINEQLPIFNYGDTFDMQLNFASRSFSALSGDNGRILHPVDVQHSAYMPIKNKMLEKLALHLGGKRPTVSSDTAKDILSELSRAEYAWSISPYPALAGLLVGEDESRLAQFLLGGMIFGEYADLLGSEHWLQPKRAALYVEAAFSDAASIGRADEEALFKWLAQKHNLPELELWQPVFLYHILDRAKRLADIPKVIEALRLSGEVKDYRHWRRQILEEWQNNGGATDKSRKTFQRLRTALSNGSSVFGGASDATVSALGAVSKPTPENIARAVTKTVPLFEPLLNYLPGRRHIKLLAKCAHARGNYAKIDRGLRSLWNTG